MSSPRNILDFYRFVLKDLIIDVHTKLLSTIKKYLHRVGKTHTISPLHYLNKGDCKYISIEKGDSITTIIN